MEPDPQDRRARRLRITPEGVALMRPAVAVWRSQHAALEARMDDDAPAALRSGLAEVR